MSTWLIIVAFVVSFVFVEFSPLGIQGLKEKNKGFGTFDMTRYNPDVVKCVLECSDGLKTYYTYYLVDTVFLVCMCGLMWIITDKACNDAEYLKTFMHAIIIIRTATDLIENILLVIVIKMYPVIMSKTIKVAYIFTNIKFAMMAAWGVLFIVSCIYGRLK